VAQKALKLGGTYGLLDNEPTGSNFFFAVSHQFNGQCAVFYWLILNLDELLRLCQRRLAMPMRHLSQEHCPARLHNCKCDVTTSRQTTNLMVISIQNHIMLRALSVKALKLVFHPRCTLH
jgi:hypothetical protein